MNTNYKKLQIIYLIKKIILETNSLVTLVTFKKSRTKALSKGGK
jgi:hypothetical protein